MFGYAPPISEMVNGAIVAIGEAILRRHDRRISNTGPLLGRMESDGPDATHPLSFPPAPDSAAGEGSASALLAVGGADQPNTQ